MSDEAELARLATLVAHEMRTPLSVAGGYMKMLASGRPGPLTDAQRRSVDGADRACQQLIALATDLSWLARILRGEVSSARAPVPLAALLAEIAAAHKPIDEHPVHVEAASSTPITGTPPAATAAEHASSPLAAATVRADAANLRRALTSLLAAVVRAAPDEATVRLVTCPRAAGGGAPARVQMALAPVAIVDDLIAAGADPDTLDPLNESIGGLGVGLPLARALLALDGGAIGTRTTPHGLGILVTLPA